MGIEARGNVVYGWPVTTNGTDAIPAIRFQSAPSSGILHAGGGNVGVCVNAARIVDVSASGMTVLGNNAMCTLGNARISSVGGNVSVGGTVFSNTSLVLPDGTPTTPALRFSNALQSGIYHTGNGKITITSNGTPVTDMSSTQIDIGASEEIVLAVQNTDRIVANARGVTFFGTVVGDFASSNPTISNVQITDNSWAIIDDTAVGSNIGGYLLVNGTNFENGSMVRVHTVSATSTAFVNSSQLRVQAPSLPLGTYDVSVIPPTGKLAMLPSCVNYSDFPVWSTSDTSLETSINGMYFSYPIATIDSNTIVTIDTVPPGTALIQSDKAIVLEGTIGDDVANDTLYSMTIDIQDPENQDASKTFTLQHVATYSSSLLKNVILKALQTSRDSAIVDAASDTLTTPNGPYPGGNAFFGGVLLPDGNVYCVPYGINPNNTARIYNPATNAVTTPTGTFSIGMNGGVLLPDGNVYCMPNSTSTGPARLYNPKNDTLTTPNGSFPGTFNPGNWTGSVLLSDGNVFCVPNMSTTARIYNPATNTLTTPAAAFPGASAYNGGVLLPNGNVFCVPYQGTTARLYNPANNTITTPPGTYPGGAAFISGVLLPDGNVFLVPFVSTTARLYNPATNALTTPTGTYPGTSAYYNGVLMPDGRVFCVPSNATTARIYNPANNTITTPPGTYAGGAAYNGGVLCADGNVFLVPRNSTTARIFTPGGTVSRPLSKTVLLSSFLNNF